MKYISNNLIFENFGETVKHTKYSLDEINKKIKEIINKVEKKKITKTELINEVNEMKRIQKSKENTDDVKKAIKAFIYDSREYIQGMKMQGNLDLDGVVTTSGYYLSDGTKINQVEKIVKKLTTPTDKNGNINIVPKDKGIIKLNNRVNIGESNTKSGELWIENAKNNNNPNGYGTLFNYNKTGNNYISGNTELKGTTTQKEGGIQIANPNGSWTYFNYKNKGNNFITGDNQFNGKVTFVGNSEIIIKKNKSSDNPKGWSTTLNNQGRNFISGSTRFHSCPSFDVDSKKIILRGDDNVNINGRSVDANVNRFNVYSHGRHTSFGSQNSGWCHIMTTAPQFYMNKGLQVQGHIRGYHEKPINADRGVHAPHLSRVGGDWLRINREGNSVGITAMYGGVSINEDRNGKGGLGVGYWGYPGNGNIKATGKIEGEQFCINEGGDKHYLDKNLFEKLDIKLKEKKSVGLEGIEDKVRKLFVSGLNKIIQEYYTVLVGSNVTTQSARYYNSNIYNILGNSNKYEISIILNIKSNFYITRNVYRYGNNNYERGPAMFIYPNNPWAMHYRLGTNRNWNEGFDFNIPEKYRKFNTDIRIRTIIEIKDNTLSVTHFVNGIYNNYTKNNTIITRYYNRNFYIKDPWWNYSYAGYDVKDVKIINLEKFKK